MEALNEATTRNERRERARSKKLGAIGRNLLMVLMTIPWYPLLLLYPWRVVFGVNAGSNNDTKNYSPDWLAKVFKWGLFWPIGIIRLPDGYGLSVGAQFSNSEIKSNDRLTRRLIKTSGFFVNAKRIALNGVIPSAATKYNAWPSNDVRYPKYEFGAIFMISENVYDAFERHRLAKTKPVAIIGCGHTGSPLVEYLEKKLDNDIYAFDSGRDFISFERAEYFKDRFEKVADCGLVIILTTLGNSGMQSIIEHLTPGTVVISDTHPKVTTSHWLLAKEKGCHCYESATVHESVSFWPSFPRWSNTTIPGCVLQALTEAHHDKSIDDQEDFARMAKEANFRARLDTPEGLS